MWVVEDVDYCNFIILLQEISFFAKNGSPCVPLATYIVANYITFRRRPDPDQFSTRKKAHVEMIRKKHVKNK